MTDIYIYFNFNKCIYQSQREYKTIRLLHNNVKSHTSKKIKKWISNFYEKLLVIHINAKIF